MSYWVKFGGWVAFMVVVGCILCAAARDGGLFGPNSSTILAGAIQAAVAGCAILFTARQAHTAYRRELQREREDKWSARADLYAEALHIVELAQRRLASLPPVVRNKKIGDLDIAQFAAEAAQIHLDAFKRFPFERLGNDEAKIFEGAHQSVLYARVSAQRFAEEVRGQPPEFPPPPVPRRDIGTDRETCALAIEEIAEALIEPIESLRSAAIQAALQLSRPE